MSVIDGKASGTKRRISRWQWGRKHGDQKKITNIRKVGTVARGDPPAAGRAQEGQRNRSGCESFAYEELAQKLEKTPASEVASRNDRQRSRVTALLWPLCNLSLGLLITMTRPAH